MNALRISHLAERLSERDMAILASLDQFRLLSSQHLQRLHFTDHATDLAAARACNRVMERLRRLGVIGSLDRRVGGVRRGSASYVWQLAAAGERYLRATQGHAHRRRFMEPGGAFVNHTLAVNDVAIGLIETTRASGVQLETLTTEPSNWRSYLGAGGETQWLKPDLQVVLRGHDAEGDYEEHFFLEIDLGTEHLPRIQTKCRIYAAYAATGAYQAQHDVFPHVVWLSSDPARRKALRTAVTGTSGLPSDLFRITKSEAFLAGLTQTSDAISTSVPDPRYAGLKPPI
jgi:hypothetical protein